MKTLVCLLRGVNVTGRNKLPMAALRAALTQAGLKDVATYIQSGNVVFRSSHGIAEAEQCIQRVLSEQFGLSVDTQLLTAAQVSKALADCPYAGEAAQDPRRVHLHFLSGKPKAEALSQLRAMAVDEELELLGKVLYLHTPGGYGKSKLAERLLDRRRLGVQVTARNYRTAEAIAAMAGAR